MARKITDENEKAFNESLGKGVFFDASLSCPNETIRTLIKVQSNSEEPVPSSNVLRSQSNDPNPLKRIPPVETTVTTRTLCSECISPLLVTAGFSFLGSTEAAAGRGRVGRLRLGSGHYLCRERLNMKYRFILPPPALSDYIAHFWTLESQGDDLAAKTFTVMSSGAPGMVFQHDPSLFTGFDGERLPQLFVFGQATRYGQLCGGGPFRTLGVQFRSAALRSVFGLNANELTDRNIPLGDLVKTSLTGQLLEGRSVGQQVACLSRFLLSQLQRGTDEDRRLDVAAGMLQRGQGIPSVLQALRLSKRSLERLFLSHIGITPILYLRICRFQASLALMRSGGVRSLTDLAYSLGYFDQSHFIRDFKLFSGASPGIYRRDTVERMPGFPEWK